MNPTHSPNQYNQRPFLIIALLLLLLTTFITSLSRNAPTVLEIKTAESANQQGGDYWSQLIGADSSYNEATNSLLTSDGSLLVSGYSRSFGAGADDGWLIKLDQTGQIQWQKTYGGSDEEDFGAPIETNDGNIIITGSTQSFNATNNQDGWILKLNQNGTIIWQKTYGSNGSDRISSIVQTNDGGYIFSGSTDPDDDGNFDAWMVRLDPAGNILWEKSYGGSNSDTLTSIQQTSDGGFIAAGGYNRTTPNSYTSWIVKLNSDGTINWEKKYSDFALLGNINELSDGSFIASGPITTDPRFIDMHLIRIDSSGQVIWQKSYGTDSFETGGAIQIINDNEFVVAGTVFGGDYWLLNLDGAGNINWQKTYGDDDKFEVAGSLQRAANGDLYIVGYSNYSNLGKTFIVKVDSNGNADNCNIVGSYNGTIVNLMAPATNANPSNQTINSTVATSPIAPLDSLGTATFTCGGPPTFTINGRVIDNNAQPLPNTTIGYQLGSVTTNASGNYTISNLPPGTYTLIPTLAGYAFTTPSNHTVTVPPDQSNLDFIGIPIIYTEFEYIPLILKP